MTTYIFVKATFINDIYTVHLQVVKLKETKKRS